MRVAHVLVPVLGDIRLGAVVVALVLDQSESESSVEAGAALGGARFLPSAFEEVVAGEVAAAFARLRAGVAGLDILLYLGAA